MENDIIIETADAVSETSFVAEIAKSFVISAATTAGFMAGMMAVGYTKKKLTARKAAKMAAAQAETQPAK